MNGRCITLCFVGAIVFPNYSTLGNPRSYCPQDYERDVANWQEILPAKEFEGTNVMPNGNVPFFNLKWHVYLENGKIVADDSPDEFENHPPVPPFDPIWAGHETMSDTWVAVPVSDGWVVAFDVGEFGAAVVWFNSDGSKQYEIGQEYVQTFLATPMGVFAQGGLSHMGLNAGAIFKLDRKSDGAWQLVKLLPLNNAFCPIAYLGHGQLLVNVGKSLHVFSTETGTVSRYGGSAVAQLENVKLYCGGRYAFNAQKLYVSHRWTIDEISLSNLKTRILLPDSRFVNTVLRAMITPQLANP